MIRVLVADDHAVVRRGVLQILEEAKDLIVTGEACTGREVLQAVREDTCDVLLLDISMPDGGGLDVLHQLQGLDADLPVLILSMYSETQYAERTIRAGAAGYLTKESAPDELIAAIRKVADGGKYVTQSLAEKMVVWLGKEIQQAPHETLSDREYQVMCLLAAGKTTIEIGAELAISAKTVGTYRGRVFSKLGLRNVAEVVRYAIEHDLTT